MKPPPRLEDWMILSTILSLSVTVCVLIVLSFISVLGEVCA